MTTQTPDAVREAYMQGQIDMRERAAQVCDQRGAEEQEGFGLVRGTQNYFRARNAVRDLEIVALDSRAGDAGEVLSTVIAAGDLLYRHLDGVMTSSVDEAKQHWNQTSVRALSATPAPAVDAVPAGEVSDMAWFGGQHRLSLSHYSPMYGDDDDQSVEWRVMRESGPINDREWDIVGRGATPYEAVAAARASLSHGEGRK